MDFHRGFRSRTWSCEELHLAAWSTPGEVDTPAHRRTSPREVVSLQKYTEDC